MAIDEYCRKLGYLSTLFYVDVWKYISLEFCFMLLYFFLDIYGLLKAEFTVTLLVLVMTSSHR